MPKAKAIQVTGDLNTLLLEWYELDSKLSLMKEREFAVRQKIVNEMGFDIAKLEGTETLDIGNGYKLKATKCQNYTLTNENNHTVNLMTALDAIGHRDVCMALVKWKPEISTKAYKDMLVPIVEANPEIKRLLAIALTIKPGAPSLELIPPKQEG